MRYFAQLDPTKTRVFYVILDPDDRIQFDPDFPVVDITHLDPLPQQGWFYNQETGEFYTKTPTLQMTTM